MCDYSLEHVKSRPAKVGDKLTTRDFGRVTRGFAASEDKNVAVCVLPGTELSFASKVKCVFSTFVCSERVINHKTAIFRRINQEHQWTNHDALEFPDRPDRSADVSERGPAGHGLAVTRGGEAACL
jgi:hypothetical protein